VFKIIIRLKPNVDTVAQNLEIIFKTFILSTRIPIGFMISTVITYYAVPSLNVITVP